MNLTIIDQAQKHDCINARMQERAVFRDGLRMRTFPDVRVTYPEVIAKTLVALTEDYNRSFATLVEANREWPEDYRYCHHAGDMPSSAIVQIDMAGLDQALIGHLAHLTVSEAAKILRTKIFEFEDSWAAYRAHALNPSDESRSAYDILSRRMLDDLRRRHGKPIALLATTEGKYASMKQSEFGRGPQDDLPDAEIRQLTGFDAFFSPRSFSEHLDRNGGQCEYLLYVPASDSPERLRDRSLEADEALLADPARRRVIEANSLTLNIDNPDWSPSDPRRINDTKMYLEDMGMAFSVESEADLAAVSGVLGDGKLRAKPALGAYGCYGHETGLFSNKKFRYRMRQNLKNWGRYMVQREVRPSVAFNIADAVDYVFMDRVFCAMTATGPVFLGGHRVFLPMESMEAKKGRLHIVSKSVQSEIAPPDSAAGIVGEVRSAA